MFFTTSHFKNKYNKIKNVQPLLLLLILTIITINICKSIHVSSSSSLLTNHNIFRILVVPTVDKTTKVNYQDNKIYRTIAYFENNTVHLKYTELVHLIQSNDNGYGKMIDTISYDTADTNRRVLLHNGNKDFEKKYQKVISNYISKQQLHIKLYITFKPFPRMPILKIHEPVDNDIIYCNNELNCTYSLPFHLSINNFVLGINGSLCINIEHFGILKRQCIHDNNLIYNNLHIVDDIYNYNNNNNKEIDVTGSTHDVNNNELVKLSLVGTGIHTIVFSLINKKDNMPIKNTIQHKIVHMLPISSKVTILSTSSAMTMHDNNKNNIAILSPSISLYQGIDNIAIETFIINLKEEIKLLQNIKDEIHKKSSTLLHNFQIVYGINLSKDGINEDPLLKLIDENKLLTDDYNEILRKEKLKIKVEAIELTRGSIGCALSHINIWESIVTKYQHDDDEYTKTFFLILEDDIYITHDFDKKLKHYMKELPKDFDIIYLGTQYYVKYQHVEIQSRKEEEGESILQLQFLKKILHDHYGTFSYMVSYNGAKKLLANVYPLKQQIDSYIIDQTNRGVINNANALNVYMFYPHLMYELKTLHRSNVQQFV